jgi:hypothetical protein
MAVSNAKWREYALNKRLIWDAFHFVNKFFGGAFRCGVRFHRESLLHPLETSSAAGLKSYAGFDMFRLTQC